MPSPLDLLNSATPPIQDFIILAGKKSPGVCTISGAGSPRAWDKGKPYGASPIMVYTGDDLSDFEVAISLWEPEHWAQWNSFARVLEKRPNGVAPKALTIIHPQLNRAPLEITEVVIRDVTQWVQGTGSKSGLWVATIPMTAWRKSQKGLGKPTGAIPAAGSDLFPPLENDPEIARLVAKTRALGGVI